jgi:hypothetical protein
MRKQLVLAAICCLALAGSAIAAEDFVLHLQDQDGNAVTDAQVVGITSTGEHIKADLLPDGTYAFYNVSDKLTIEVEHAVHGNSRAEVVFFDDGNEKGGTQLEKTMVIGHPGFGPMMGQDPPANDLCENAIPVAVPSVTFGTTIGATIDWPEHPDCGTYIYSPGVWYSVTGTGYTITATTCNFATYDTKISVYCRGCDVSRCVGGNDDDFDCEGFRSTFSWCSEADVEYLILVHGFFAEGDFELEIFDDGIACEPDVICSGAPENDLCEDAIPIDIPSATMGTTAGADIDWPAAPDCGTIITSPGVWYSLVGDGTTLTATTCSEFTEYDTKLSVYCRECEDLLCVDGNDDDWDCIYDFRSTVTWCTQASAEYLILVHGFGGAEGEFELLVSSDGMACDDPVSCLPTGAACFYDATCVDGLTEYMTGVLGGTYQGDGTVCGGGLVGWTGFEDCGSPFEDISGTGTELILGDDDGVFVPIGFDFNFWGDVHGEIAVCSNGYLTFGDDLTDYSNDVIPDDYDPNNFIAPLWDDFSPDDGGTVHYQTLGVEPDRRFIAQWTDVPQWLDTDKNTFQAVLFEGTNCIEFRYGAVTPEGFTDDYTIGIENQDGTDGFSVPGHMAEAGFCQSICPIFDDPIVCPFLPPMDIKPGSCPNPLNTRSNGVLPIAVLGTEWFDVYNVDPATVTLVGVPPLRWAYEDVATPMDMMADVCDCNEYGPDGLMDMTLKFDTQEIVAALGAVTDGEYRPLMLAGMTYDGIPAYAEDCVWIKDKGKDPVPPPVISVGTFTGTESTIQLSLFEATEVKMSVYSVQGKLVRTVVDGVLSSGEHKIAWDGRDDNKNSVANGVYFCKVTAGSVNQTVKMLKTQ